MSCTTLLVGKGASNDGSTMIARNDDSGGGRFTAKKFVVVNPQEQPRVYESVLSHVKIELPDNPLRYTAVPNAVEGEGIWAAGGINEANVGMTATETISANERVLAADPLMQRGARKHGEPGPADGPGAADGHGVLEGPGKSGDSFENTVCLPVSSPRRGVSAAPDPEPGGIGEEDIVVLVLPYIRSAREGVRRLGMLLEQYGTYEMNGIAFQDVNEIWYLETIGGHHWMARRVPDHACAIIPNQLSIDFLDLDDALGEQRDNMCSSDLLQFVEEHHLDLEMPCRGPHGPYGPHGPHSPYDMHGLHDLHDPRGPHGPHGPSDPHGPHRGPHPGPDSHHPGAPVPPPPHAPREGDPDRRRSMSAPADDGCIRAHEHIMERGAGKPDEYDQAGCGLKAAEGEERPHRILNTRLAFGTRDDADHVYNTPRAWYMGRCLAPHAFRWDGPGADFTPASNDIPWCIVPEHRVTVEEVKYILSSHYQETPYDPYGSYGDPGRRGAYRSIGINRTDVLAILQIRPDQPEAFRAVEWISFASNAFNVSVPFYANVRKTPAYLSCTTGQVSTESFYWAARLIAVLADACVQKNLNHIEHYQQSVAAQGRALIARYDRLQARICGSSSAASTRAASASPDAPSAAEPETDTAGSGTALLNAGMSAGTDGMALREKANEEIAAMLRKETDGTLDHVLREASNHMKNQYLRSDH